MTDTGTRSFPPDVIERDLNRLMGFGLVRAFACRSPHARRQRVYTVELADGTKRKWGPQATYAFVTGAMLAFEMRERVSP